MDDEGRGTAVSPGIGKRKLAGQILGPLLGEPTFE
jgi:hypothetical protein